MSSVDQPAPAPPPYRQGHSSRRDNQSVSSVAGSSRGSERGNRSGSHPAVESAVTRLLVAIKQLLEALSLWSNLKMSETQVSDVYVRLGNDFLAAVSAFSAFNIDMNELLSVPEDLRNVLEQCLAEEATPENLEMYLPTVRQIITNLLQGLRGKQSSYRRIVSDHRHRSSEQSGHERTESRSSRGSRRDGGGGQGHRTQASRAISESDRVLERDSVPSRRTPQSSSIRNEMNIASNGDTSSTNEDEPFIGGFVAPQPDNHTTDSNGIIDRSSGPPPPRKQAPPPRSDSLSHDSTITAGGSPSVARIPGNETETTPPSTPPTPAQVKVPASVKRYSLVDKPAPPAVVVDAVPDDDENPGHDRNSQEYSPTPPPETPPLDATQMPAMANSLAALKRSEALERRASKRFSTYNISKMTGGSMTRDRSVRNHPNRRSLLAAGSALTPEDLAAITEVDDEGPALSRETSATTWKTAPSRVSTPMIEEEAPPSVPPLPSTRSPSPAFRPPESAATKQLSEPTVVAPQPIESFPGRPFPVFLQLGREVKKVTIDPGLSLSNLRMLFLEKFSYNPGLENFPAIYIRDSSSGVQYELEEMNEVKEKCLLSLNIEPLDQIKQHIDTQISTLSQDIKELKMAVTSINRQSNHMLPTDYPLAESTPPPARPTDRQFQHVARRLSRLISNDSVHQPLILPQMTGQSLQPQMTGGSVLSEYSSRVMTDLKTQFDEVQNLRRDLGIMRQLYTEFMKQTKESLSTLRTQTQSVKQLATDNVGGARGYIDSGKTKLDTRSQNVLTKIEELQDTVEGVKDDVLKKHITPKSNVLKQLKSDVDTVAKELESLREHINTIKPMWKKTWEEELQNIVEEQQFLHHQEEFLNDLLEDHKAVLEVYGHVEKVISIRGTGSGRAPRGLRGFKPPPPEEGHDGLSTVMLEIRSAAVDQERRMKAIAASQKNREKELANRSDEFQAELSGFVGGKKLKMTGGAEEVERVRQKRNDMTLKAMFNNTPPSSSGQPSPASEHVDQFSPAPSSS